jgi:predicted MFS family arabinose efflux permease
MNANSRHEEEKPSTGRLVLPSLTLSSFTTQSHGLLTALLLIEIGQTFGSSVAVTGQIRTFSAVTAFIFALLTGALSIRFRQKSLLLTGIIFFIVSAIGCAFAPNFNMMLVAYSLSGVGFALVWPMIIALVGSYFSPEKRAGAIGWINVGPGLSFVIGAPVINFIAGYGGWRAGFLGFVLPIAILSLLMTAKYLSKPLFEIQTMDSGEGFLEGFKRVFSNRSASACVVGSMLLLASFQVIYLYSASFLRQRFLISTGFASIVLIIMALCFAFGSLSVGRFVDKFGMKPLTVGSILLFSVFTISFTLLPNLWLALTMLLLGFWFWGLSNGASSSLILEQVPRYPGTMMSASTAAMNIGEAVGAGVGGLVLLLFNWGFLGVALGAMGIVAALVFHFFTVDPTSARLFRSNSKRTKQLVH